MPVSAGRFHGRAKHPATNTVPYWTWHEGIIKPRVMNDGHFHKMHGLGNDFVIIDGRRALPALSPAQIRHICDRHRGIGCDQLIMLEQSATADIRMRIFNADGGEVEACGNASRCVTALLSQEEGTTPDKNISIETAGGTISGSLSDSGATINMGTPRFDWEEIPLAFPMDTRAMPLAWEELSTPMAVNIGNPHVVFFVPDSEAVDLARLGPVIETDPAFPERVNVNVASVRDGYINLRVWERGAGLTKACGTGACATAVAAIRHGLVHSPVEVRLPGGALQISWDGEGAAIMTGPASYAFEGFANWDDFG